ncbi:chromate transporter [Paenibacillus wulumuqiensis]|uniref:chromate transporter n=1 Tax=Paenibacillus wulumuqiensis TaxID=1567107 RepID=UPI0006197F3A|nr:chromate transporter [Paenibacillus wulumuqiensis]
MKKPHRYSFNILLELFLVFFKIGPATFGGGYAMIPMIEREIVHKRRWINEQELDDLLSLAGSAPGGVGVNASTFIGYRMGRVPGAIAALLGITFPTFLIVFAISLFYSRFGDVHKVQAAFLGIKGAVIGLIAVAAYRMGKNALFDRTTIIVAAGALILLLLTGLNPVILILCGLLLGILIIRVKKHFGLNARTEKERPADQDRQAQIEYYI